MSMSHEIRKAISMNSEERPGSLVLSLTQPPFPTDPSVAGSYPIPQHWCNQNVVGGSPVSSVSISSRTVISIDLHSPLSSRHVDVLLPWEENATLKGLRLEEGKWPKWTVLNGPANTHLQSRRAHFILGDAVGIRQRAVCKGVSHGTGKLKGT